MNDPVLHPVLDRASDGVRPARSPQHAAGAALAQARVVRRRRRAAGVTGAVAAAVVVATALLGVPGADRSEPPVAPAPTAPPARGVADADVQPTFDPRAAGTLPRRASVLPVSLAVPPRADLGGLPPAGPVRLVLARGARTLLLLGEDGRWSATRSPSGENAATGLSDDGTLLAAAGPRGLWVVDVRDGRWREVALPDGPGSTWRNPSTRVQWQDDDHVALSDLGQLGVTPTDGGTAGPTSPVGRRVLPVSGFVPLGSDRQLVLGANRGGGGSVVAEVEGDRIARIVPTAALGTLWRPVANDRRLAATVTGIPREDRPTDRSGVLVADRDTFDATAYLPVAGTRYDPRFGEDTPGGVAPWGWLDGDTVLLGTDANGRAPWRLVAWDTRSGERRLVATGDSGTRLVAVAGGLLGP